MFVGHYDPSFAIKAIRPAVPLWLLFIAVQLVDMAWAVLVLLGVEKVRIVPGIAASNRRGVDRSRRRCDATLPVAFYLGIAERSVCA